MIQILLDTVCMVKCNNYFIKSKYDEYFVFIFCPYVLTEREKEYFCSGKN